MRIRHVVSILSGIVLAHSMLAACSSSQRDPFVDGSDGATDAAGFSDVVPESDVLPAAPPDPKTCDEAKTMQSYIGCDYWPTVTSNVVDDIFDFAVAVANVGDQPASVTVK